MVTKSKLHTSGPPQTSARRGESTRGLLKGLLGFAARFFLGSSSLSSSSVGAGLFLAGFFLGLTSCFTFVLLPLRVLVEPAFIGAGDALLCAVLWLPRTPPRPGRAMPPEGGAELPPLRLDAACGGAGIDLEI